MQRTSSPTLPLSSHRLRREALQLVASNLRSLVPGRVVIAGGPSSGKSTLAAALSGYYRVPVRSTDDLRGLAWSTSSDAASYWLDRPGPWICEGVVMPRALRKWLAREHERSPADLIIWVNAPTEQRGLGQEAMAKGCATIWNEILPALALTGAHVIAP